MILPAPGSDPARLALGLAALGRPAYHTLDHGADFPGGRSVEDLRARCHAVLDAAFEAGIRYVDAARSYGAAESFVRAWADARQVGPRDVAVGSKWGYRYVGGWRLDAERHEVKEHSLATLRAQHAESVAALGPLLSLWQIHSATADGPVLRDGAVLDELARLRAAGLRIGVTVSGPAQADAVARALDVERDGRPLFDAIQATWNLLEPSCGPRLAEAHAAGRIVIVKEPLANGRLTSRGGRGAADPLLAVARRLGATPDAVALAAALARPWASLVLLGAATVAQLRSNLAARALALSPGDLDALGALAEPAAGYWSARATLPWT
jgi:aryl-alcohol dehydrogenase-like predicted oxidoreductase